MNETKIAQEYKKLVSEFRNLFGELMLKSGALGSLDSEEAVLMMKGLMIAEKLMDLSIIAMERDERVADKFERYLDKQLED